MWHRTDYSLRFWCKVSFIFQHACCVLLLTFSCIYILQGSVATQLRCSGIFNNHFIFNCRRKNFENRLIFVKDMDNYKVARFFETQCKMLLVLVPCCFVAHSWSCAGFCFCIYIASCTRYHRHLAQWQGGGIPQFFLARSQKNLLSESCRKIFFLTQSFVPKCLIWCWIPYVGETFWEAIKILGTRNFLCQKFSTFCPHFDGKLRHSASLLIKPTMLLILHTALFVFGNVKFYVTIGLCASLFWFILHCPCS